MRNEDGEFELVLGNKQMLSVFFIVMVMLGAFFAMGYVVGKNSAPVTAAAVTAEPYVRSDARSAMAPRREEPAVAASPVAEAPVASNSIGQPKLGETYLQVSAVARTEAEMLTGILLKKGFRAIVAPGPNEELYRVLVGPAQDVAESSRLKADLEQAGFKPIVRKIN
ncbi:MAG: SPOR domain-containing protein [Bryobacteraceae bacterium]